MQLQQLHLNNKIKQNNNSLDPFQHMLLLLLEWIQLVGHVLYNIAVEKLSPLVSIFPLLVRN